MRRLPRRSRTSANSDIEAAKTAPIQLTLFPAEMEAAEPIDTAAAATPNVAGRRPRRRKKLVQSVKVCVWCGGKKPIEEMRHPLSSRGQTPSTCHACREAHPDLGWCDYHNEPHDRELFPQVNRPIGISNRCILAESEKVSNARGLPPITCVSCNEELTTWNFRGGKQKSPTCRKCESDHPEERWCMGCEMWLSESEFHRTGIDGKFWTVRCKPCKNAHAHGTTVKELLALQGSDTPECGSCRRSGVRLMIDHDHACCPSVKSCGQCVRGYLCHECNTAEGLLRTPERAVSLAGYMTRTAAAKNTRSAAGAGVPTTVYATGGLVYLETQPTYSRLPHATN
ncbi:endonuclease domain-containing protein [Arthrobacter sp. NPDC058130]|uniref:endonuclease domain-containing protein n=1 Tax=Arthrobacter sp. NPDC058130 TaxID=3346353 RepID=UPI0036E364E3